MKIDSKGIVGLDKRLDLTADLRVSPALSIPLTAKAGVSEFTTDDDGWTILPLTIKGTASKPSVGLNPDVLGKQVGKGVFRTIKKKVIDKVINLFR